MGMVDFYAIAERAQQNACTEKKCDEQVAVDNKKKVKPKEDLSKVGFVAKPLVLCSIPNTKPTVSRYFRNNGTGCLELRATAPEEYGLPYGRDRKLLFWIKKQVTLLKSDTIYFRDGSQILRDIGYDPNSGDNIEWLKQALLRCHNTLIYFVHGDPMKGGGTMGELIISKINGFVNDRSDANGRSFIRVSQHFFDMLYVKVDLEIIEKLGRDYAAMDLYVYLVDRQDRAKDTVVFRFEELRSHFAIGDKIPNYKMKQDLKKSLKKLNDIGFHSGCKIEDNLIYIPPRKRS